jgi:hypothetical protein
MLDKAAALAATLAADPGGLALCCVDVRGLCGGTADVLRARTLGSLTDVEFDSVAFAQILQPLAVHGALVEKVLLLGIILDEPKTLVHS